MNKKKWTSLLMILALLLTLLPAPELSAMAEGDTPSDKDNGMKISKTAVANSDGTYTITLEAYATGSKVISEVKEDVPTDIILVLDQSGSMKNTFSRTTEDSWESYGNQTNGNNYDLRMRNNNQNGNLYYKLSDGSYVGVSIDRTRETIQDYVEYDGKNGSCYYLYNNNNTLYAETDEGYKQVEVKRSWDRYTYTYTYTYTRNDGTVVTKTSDGAGGNPPYAIYRLQDTDEYTYEYYYTVNGVRTIIGTQSRGKDTTFDVEFYKRLSTVTSITALEALQRAVRNFTSAVETKAAGKDGVLGTSDDINHRIAVVGFASGSYYEHTDYDYGNTEVFIGSSQYKYGTNAQGQYANAFQNMNTSTGVSNINASIGALGADGGTLTNLGLEMANGIFSNNPLQQNEKRNRVVIVFTDGAPGWSGYESTVANSAISQASTAKSIYGATVYTVGIFSGADATSAGNQNGDDTQKANWFMQQVSSNNGTPQSPSYYLSAGDSGALNNIFQQISSQIEDGGSSTTLDGNTVIKDIISPSFVLQTGTAAKDIVLETYACTGIDANGKPAFAKTKNTANLGENVKLTSSENNVSEDNPKVPDQVNVTGFDFSANWCGVENNNGTITPHGNKLVIKIKVEPRPGFFGGNGVTTNTSAGVYENENAEKPTFTFDQPKVDVPLVKVDVKAPEANVYLGAHLNETVPEANVLKNGATVQIGDSTLDFSQENYGLKPWQNEYVNIEASVSTSGSFENMTEDAGYTVAVKVTPKTPEGAKGKEASATGTIHVFKPELTFKDSEVSYMASIADYDYNKEDYVETKWRHQDEGDTTPKYSNEEDVTMLGNAQPPELTYEYTPDVTRLTADKKVKATDYVPVAVKVKLGETDVTNKTTFVHQCDVSVAGGCQWATPTEKGNPAFLLHVINVYGDLTITKNGMNQHTYTGDGEDQESAIFTVSDGKGNIWTVAINGNNSVTLTGLKVGSYIVTELTDWTWRYTVADNKATKTVEVKGGDVKNEVTFTNTHTNQQWLGGDNYANNVFASTTGN